MPVYAQSNEKFEQRFSNYNELNLPQVIERIGSKFDSVSGYREELKYNVLGKIIEQKVFSKSFIETIRYKYDKRNNVIEINRSNESNVPYPMYVDGGFPIYEKEEFQYKYDKRGYWIKKIHLANGKKILIEKRNYK